MKNWKTLIYCTLILCLNDLSFGSTNKNDFFFARSMFESADNNVFIASGKTDWACSLSSYVLSDYPHLSDIRIEHLSENEIIIYRQNSGVAVPEVYSKRTFNGVETWSADGTSTLSNSLYMRHVNASTIEIEATMSDNGGISDQVLCNNSRVKCYFGPAISNKDQRVSSYEICRLKTGAF